MRLSSQKTPSPPLSWAEGAWPPRGWRARHDATASRGTWEILAVLPGVGVPMNKGNSEAIGTTGRKSEGA